MRPILHDELQLLSGSEIRGILYTRLSVMRYGDHDNTPSKGMRMAASVRRPAQALSGTREDPLIWRMTLLA
jgi:hypothetical protein